MTDRTKVQSNSCFPAFGTLVGNCSKQFCGFQVEALVVLNEILKIGPNIHPKREICAANT